jgi:predicted hydrocarbon binding protein
MAFVDMGKKKDEASAKAQENPNFESTGIIDSTKNKVSEFFFHLAQYGGVNFKDGVLYLWLNPTVLIPVSSFAVFQKECEKICGKDFDFFLYWLGKITGKNSSIVLNKRYGFKLEDLPSFLNGATQDGFGYMEIGKVNVTSYPKNGIVFGKDNPFSDAVVKKYGVQKNPIDFYICGVLTGGTEPLFGINIHGSESECLAKGDKRCVYNLTEIKQPETCNLVKKAGLKEEDIFQKALKLYSGRKGSFTILQKKDVNFGDGSFVLKGLKGGLIEIYAVTILDYVMSKVYGEKYNKVLELTAKEAIKSLNLGAKKKNESLSSLQERLSKLDLLGYGHFNAVRFTGNTLIVKNSTNPYPDEYKFIFGPSKKPVDIYPTYLLKAVMETVFDKKISVKEVQCKASMRDSCIFEIKVG